jgi:hypothetical protein
MDPIAIAMLTVFSVLLFITFLVILYCVCCSPNQDPRRARAVIPVRYERVGVVADGEEERHRGMV